MFTLNCAGNLLVIEDPVIMGIINATTDSFYKGNMNDDILTLAEQLIKDGATIIDIGGQSTKPGSKRIAAKEELRNVISIIEKIKSAFPQTIISIDTFYSLVAKEAVAAGAGIVNDISAGKFDNAMLTTVGLLNVPFVCMHMLGEPGTMQQNPMYSNVVKEVLDFFIQQTELCRNAGIKDIILDPGFGFGKTIEHNYTLLKNLGVFSFTELPIMVGLSRKSMIYKPLNSNAAEALNGTTALHMIALLNGTSILRVHDVKAAKEAVTLYQQYKKAP